MYFNEKKMRRDLIEKQTQERMIMLSEGMPERDVEDVFNLDMEQLRGDIRFYKWLGFYLKPDNETLAGKDTTTLDVMGEIEDPALHAALQRLNPKERSLVLLHVVEGLPLRLIALLWNKPASTIGSTYNRAIKKLQKSF